MSSGKGFPCNTCDLVFQNSQAQRAHMREPWHLYNLKRRMASLPPLSERTFAESVATNLVAKKHERSQITTSEAVVKLSIDNDQAEVSDLENQGDEDTDTNRCLFCTKTSESLEINLRHMSSEHGLYIPWIDELLSLEALVDYLHTLIAEYNECLYCGMVKQSAEGARRHMLDKGHCMINLESEPELLEFWEFSHTDENDTFAGESIKTQARSDELAASKDLSEGEYTLPSGKVIGTKKKARDARVLARRITTLDKQASDFMITQDTTDSTATTSLTKSAETCLKSQGEIRDRPNAIQSTISSRDAVGLIGVSDQQLWSLATTQRRMQRQQAIERALAPWAAEKGGTHQKHYKQKMNLRDG